MKLRREISGAALTEIIIIGVPLLMVLTLGMVQLILIGHARTTLNYAALLAARQGALYNADVEPMKKGLALGLAPMFGAVAANDLGESGHGTLATYALPAAGQGYKTLSAPQGMAWWHPANPIRREASALTSEPRAIGSADAKQLAGKAQDLALQDVDDYAKITITNPTTQVFADFARPIRIADGEVGIPNAGLYRMTGKSTSKITVQVCEPVATPTVKDMEPALEIKTPSKTELKNALLGGIADSDWSAVFRQGGFAGQESIMNAYRNKLSVEIDKVNLSSQASTIAFYNKIRSQANQFLDKHKSLPPELHSEVLSVSSMADILAKSTAGPFRPSEGEIKAAIGDAGTPGGRYLDLGNGALQNEWDVYTCGDASYNQYNTGCVHNKAKSKSLFGAIQQAFTNSPDDINYTDLSNKIDEGSAKFIAVTNSLPGFLRLSYGQKSYVQHIQSFFQILGNSRQLGPYRNSQQCHNKTVDASTQPAVGPTSGVDIQDANLLKIYVVYGYKLIIPFVGPAIVDFMRYFDSPPAGGIDAGLVQKIYHSGRIPLTATAVVRMQSPAYQNSDMLSRDSSFFLKQ